MEKKRKKLNRENEAPIIGKFISNMKGFGFVEVEGMDEDLFIPASKTNGAFHQDLVKVRFLPGSSGKRKEAEVTEIIARGFTQVVGTYEKSKNFGFVIPDNGKIACDIFVPKDKAKGAVDGHKVVVEITRYAGEDGARNPEGKIVEILGHINDPGVDILSIVKAMDIPTDFTEKQLKQAERVAKEVSPADCEGRTDLRDVLMVTIDGEDAKDLDDAVSLHIDEEGVYHLGVHIADVTNYVQENSALDREALNRGTSVYLTDRVIPMLPQTLSNGICSLNAGEDRLALSCLMRIDEKGNLKDYDIVESVITVDRRMSYTEVKEILLSPENYEEEYGNLVSMFVKMLELSKILRKNRRKRGAIDFDFPECKIKLNKKGRPIEIVPYERNDATKLIEDFMLMANETIAQHFFWLELPFVYRIHETPDPEKIRKLVMFLKNMGFPIHATGDEVHPKEVQKLLEKIEGSEEEPLISRLTLRSMRQAVYSPDCLGHFGLACQYYCHFTSPIRRYPDLQIHRIIKDYIRGRMKEERLEHYRSILDAVAKQSSVTERRAVEAERETDKLKKTEYMEERIGNTYEGVVSGVTAWGVYVELPNTIEGMIPISLLPYDNYQYDETHYTLTGEFTNRSFRLGQSIRIRVRDADIFTKTIDFELSEDEDDGSR